MSREATHARLPFLFLAAGLAIGPAFAGCRQAAGPPGGKAASEMPTRSIEAVLQDHTPELMRIPGVVGTAQSERDGRPVILALVERDTAWLRERLPRQLEGYAVELLETDKVRAMEPGDREP